MLYREMDVYTYSLTLTATPYMTMSIKVAVVLVVVVVVCNGCYSDHLDYRILQVYPGLRCAPQCVCVCYITTRTVGRNVTMTDIRDCAVPVFIWYTLCVSILVVF